MGLTSAGDDVSWTSTMILVFLAVLQLAVSQTDHKAVRKVLCYHSLTGNRTVYDYEITDADGKQPIDWSQYRDQVLLVVNVASFCGSTPQYFAMNALQSKFKDFRVLGVPCNQFGLQEPGKNGTEILNSLKYVRPGNGFEPNFELTTKIDVNGPDEHPLYSFLKAYCPPATIHFAKKHRLAYDGLKANDIRWNFEKFLIDRRGVPVIHYSEMYLPHDIEADISDMLMASSFR